MTQEQVNKIASYPTDSGFLIPDSLLLIPDISQSEDCSLSVDNSRKEKIPYQQILDMFHANCPSLSTVQILSDKRKSAIGSIWKMDERHRDMEFWRWYFQKIEASDFLTGRKKQGDWKADFDFTINKNKLIRIVEGTYDNR